VEVPTGSLGMGLSNGAGMAWGARRLANGGAPPFYAYVILSDGECFEGQTWEAAIAAANYGLDNLVAIVDYNHFVVTGPTERALNLEPFVSKWRAFGWHAVEVDGHDLDALRRTLEEARRPEVAPGKPRMIVAHTIKGRGVSFTEGDNAWHSGHLDEAQYRRALADLALNGGRERE
jgi:transketolase